MIKKMVLTGIVIASVLGIRVFAGQENSGVGIKAIKDTYTKKTYVLEVMPDSSASVSGVPVGAEIVKINDKKIRGLSADEINFALSGNDGGDVVLQLKNDKEKFIYTLKRDNYNIQEQEDAKFTLHWNQIAPKNLYLKKIPSVVLEHLSTDYQEDILAKQGYWLKQKAAFTKGYDTCLTYPEEEQNTCLLNLVNTINNNISRNKQLDIHGDGVARQQDGIPVYNVNQIMLQNAFQNLGDRY